MNRSTYKTIESILDNAYVYGPSQDHILEHGLFTAESIAAWVDNIPDYVRHDADTEWEVVATNVNHGDWM
jgi:hypothetical protein